LVPGYYLFIARTASSTATFKQLKDDMDALVERAGKMTATMPDMAEGNRITHDENGPCTHQA